VAEDEEIVAVEVDGVCDGMLVCHFQDSDGVWNVRVMGGEPETCWMTQ
jgi:hypothetical protein